MIGFISPKGKFIECCSWGHTEKAIEICSEEYKKEFTTGQGAEDYLLSHGYLVLRASDAYMSYLNEKSGKWIVLTDEQIDWLTMNVNSLNENQKKDLNEILHDQEQIRKRHSVFAK